MHPLQRGSPNDDQCAGGLCAGLAQYPVVTPDSKFPVSFSAVFDVPELPQAAEDLDGITDYIYCKLPSNRRRNP